MLYFHAFLVHQTAAVHVYRPIHSAHREVMPISQRSLSPSWWAVHSPRSHMSCYRRQPVDCSRSKHLGFSSCCACLSSS